MTQRIAVGGVLFLVAIGALFSSPTAVWLALAPGVYLLAGGLSRVPPGAKLALERTVDPATARPGEPVDVTLTVDNRSESNIADLRVVDPVPDELSVTDGSPRLATPLTAGETATLNYSVVATRGEYDYEEVTLRARSAFGTDFEDLLISASGDTAIECSGAAEAPVGDTPQLKAGTQVTDQPGEGVEFRSVREYRYGDDVGRIDWRKYAKTGDLATVQYRAERALRFLILVDAREATHLVPEPGYPSGTEASGYAGQLLYDALDNAGHSVSVAAAGVSWTDGASQAGLAWVDESGPANPTDLFETISETDHWTSQTKMSPQSTSKRLRALMRPDTHVLLVSPLPDDWAVSVAQELRANGFRTTAISPELASDQTPGARVSKLERNQRFQALSRLDIETVRWPRDQPLRASLARSLSEVLGQ